jgi:WXG100 family type VII secretion target
MAMTPVNVTPEMVTAAAGSCDATAQEIDGELASLKRYVENLHSIWGGVSANQWASLMADFDIFGRMLHNSLTDIGQGLRGNAINYVDTERANIASLQAVNGDIPGARL